MKTRTKVLAGAAAVVIGLGALGSSGEPVDTTTTATAPATTTIVETTATVVEDESSDFAYPYDYSEEAYLRNIRQQDPNPVFVNHTDAELLDLAAQVVEGATVEDFTDEINGEEYYGWNFIVNNANMVFGE